MPVINFILPDGTERRQNAEIGTSVMEAARSAGIAEVVAECGGSLSCATCHVVVAPDWVDRMPPAAEDEKDLLEGISELQPTSRLSCQIKVTSALDGVRIKVTAAQF